MSRTAKRRVAVPPLDQLRTEATQLRELVPDDPHVTALCDAVEEIAEGYLRVGGPDEPRRWPLHPAWGGKEPPERP